VSPDLDGLRRARRILCVQPHYDDNDLGAGGTLAALAEGGAELCYLTVTDDVVGVIDPELSDDEARERIRAEQRQAGHEIGVREQIRFEYPDAGRYDYFELRDRLVREMRRFRPDFVFSVDPWLPLEAHQDHLRTGRAVVEAAMLQGRRRLRLDGEPTRAAPHPITGIVFYFTKQPNAVFDISGTRERKHRAIDAYRAQFTPDQLKLLHAGLDFLERRTAEDQPFSHAEPLCIRPPGHFHVHLFD
jgi:LmbE family N-acetylglucosaminyl deacetylase